MAHWREHTPLTNAGSIPGVDAICGFIKFVVGSLPCSERFSFRYSGFPLSSKSSANFQFPVRLGIR